MNKKDGVPAIVFLVMGLVGLSKAIQLPWGGIHRPEAGFFPLILSSTVVLVSLLLLFQSFKKSEKVKLGWPSLGENAKNLIPIVISFILYALFLRTMGYVICTLAVLILFVKLERRSWGTAFLLSILCSVISYLIFARYLNTPLPRGILPF